MNQRFKEVYRLVALLCLLHFVTSNFLESPTSQRVNVGNDAIFRCQHETADSYRWKINGTLLSFFMRPPGVTTGTTDIGNNLVHTLTIVGRLDYNQTEVACVARFDSGMEEETTHGAFLYVHVDLGFVETPSPQNVSAEEIATFQCQHSTADLATWKLNGTLLNSYTPPNTSVVNSLLSNGDFVSRLVITALAHYNTTQIVCVAIFTSGIDAVESTPALLLIQGPLDRVVTLGRVTTSQRLHYTWKPPYSLDLTAVTPDVLYCLDVFKITCGLREHIISDCGISDHFYMYSLETFNTSDLYEAIVIPRSNSAVTNNGTPAVTTDQYIMVNDTSWNTVIGNHEEDRNMTIQLVINLNAADDSKVTPDSFVVVAVTVDNENIERRLCRSPQFPKSTAVFTEPLDCLLPPRRLWMATLHVGRCVEQQVSDAKEISTYDVQNITVVVCNESAVTLGNFINGTTAIGVLVLMYSESPARIVATVVHQQASFQVQFSGLNWNHRYRVCTFIVDENGLPLESAATLTRPVDMTSPTIHTCDSLPVNQEVQEPLITVKMSTDSKNNETCIHCFPRDGHVSSCVVIIFETDFQKTYSSYINVFTFNKTSDDSEIRGCLKDTNLNITYQQVVVFPFVNGSIVGSGVVLSLKDESTAEEADLLSYLKIVLPSATAPIILILTMIGLYCCYRLKGKKHSICQARSQKNDQELHLNESATTVTVTGIAMHRCDAYESTDLYKKKRVVTKENSAYGVIIE